MFKSEEIILTHTGMLGDFFFCLPIASWLFKTHGVKIHWVLVDGFPPFQYLTPLLMRQPFTAKVSLVPHAFHWECGGQPYKFNPSDYGIPGEYYNLGFRCFPDKYISAFYAEDHGWDYDKNYRLDLGPGISVGDEVVRSREAVMKILAPNATPLPPKQDLLELIRRIASAKKVHAWFGGVSIMCHMIKREFICYFSEVNGNLDIRKMYVPDNNLVDWRNAREVFDWGSPFLQLTDP
jgi:hypothetical protein